jgi:Cysteine-rich CPCC
MIIGISKVEEAPPSPDGIAYFVNAFGLPAPDTFYHCPCCFYPTLPTRGGFEVCPVCYWEDDGQDSHDADRLRGGPNGVISLTQARANYIEHGSCDVRFSSKARKPTHEEIKYRNHVR